MQVVKLEDGTTMRCPVCGCINIHLMSACPATDMYDVTTCTKCNVIHRFCASSLRQVDLDELKKAEADLKLAQERLDALTK